jgi:hypothetical protein
MKEEEVQSEANPIPEEIANEEMEERIFAAYNQRQIDVTTLAAQSFCFDIGHLCGLVNYTDLAQIVRFKTLHITRLLMAWANSADIGNEDVTMLCNKFSEMESVFHGGAEVDAVEGEEVQEGEEYGEGQDPEDGSGEPGV